MKRSIFIFFCFILNGCIEEFVPATITFEDLLVVEATITDEFKSQEIKLSRTFPFEEQSTSESMADVRIVDDMQNVYLFNETDPGKYISSTMFSIEPNRNYTLKINTKDNKSYSSSSAKLPSNTAQVTGVSYAQTTNSDGVEGIDILVDSFDPSGNARYYRYQFEETDRVTAGSWGPQEIIIVSDVPPFAVTAIPNTRNNRICYRTTITSDVLIQTQTNNFTEDRITKFPVKFISKTNSLIRDRYSILVKQHVQSLEAFTYYKVLDELSSSESLLSQNQPGFFEGNIFSETDSNEKVLGYFELTSVSTNRMFLNYKDVFPSAAQLSNFANCGIGSRFKPALVDPENPNFSPLIDLVQRNLIVFYSRNEDFFGEFIEDPPFTVVPRRCGDCTFWGTNVKPDFWID